MRILLLAPLCLLAACSETAEADDKTAAKPATMALAAGQWETTTQITAMDTDEGFTPAIDGEVGGTSTVTSCIAEGQVEKPDAIVFAGVEGADCGYDNFYMSRGRINAAMSCTKPGDARLLISADGSFTDTSFETTTDK